MSLKCPLSWNCQATHWDFVWMVPMKSQRWSWVFLTHFRQVEFSRKYDWKNMGWRGPCAWRGIIKGSWTYFNLSVWGGWRMYAVQTGAHTEVREGYRILDPACHSASLPIETFPKTRTNLLVSFSQSSSCLNRAGVIPVELLNGR